MENKANHQEVLAELVFAGMIDVQDRMLCNRSYTTGHKAYRARSTVEIGNAHRLGQRASGAVCRVRWISPSGRAGIRPMRWPATA